MEWARKEDGHARVERGEKRRGEDRTESVGASQGLLMNLDFNSIIVGSLHVFKTRVKIMPSNTRSAERQ